MLAKHKEKGMGVSNIFESLRIWQRTPFTLTFFWDLTKTYDEFEVAASIRNFSEQLDVSNHSVKRIIHFLRMFLLPAGDKGRDQIVLSVVFDGEKTDFLNLLIDGFGDALKKVLKSVHGSDELDGLQCDGDFVTWLLASNCEPSTYHVGAVRSSVSDIKSDREVYLAIASFLDSRDDLGEQSPQKIKKLIVKKLRKRLPNINADTARNTSQQVRKVLDACLFVFLVLLIPLFPAILVVVAMKWALGSLLWLVPIVALIIVLGLAAFIRYLEYVEEDVPMWPDASHLNLIAANENKGLQNQMTLVVDVKPSVARRLVISIVLWIADAVSRHWYTRGKLVGIDTIHFARFFLLQGRKRMMFLSDYDGSWGRYLFDFTGVGALAVVPIWSSLQGCPKARFLRWPATGFEERFLPFTRCCQIEVQCWYSSYPRLTVSEIKRNEKIRAGLFKRSSDSQILTWLSLFGGAQ